MVNFIWVKTQKEFLHQYYDAPELVAFLKNKHSHIFKFKVAVEVFNNDRDIEFIILRRQVEDILNKLDINLNGFSCEMLSNHLYEEIKSIYPKRDMIIDVSEDGNYGSNFYYQKTITKFI